MSKDITLFARTNYRNQEAKFGIKRDDRRRHMYIIGKTGMGKTNLMENMAISDIRNGNGLCVVDPHGEFADKMLDYIPQNESMMLSISILEILIFPLHLMSWKMLIQIISIWLHLDCSAFSKKYGLIPGDLD